MPLFARGHGQAKGGPPPSPPRVLFLDDDPERAEVFLAENPHAVWVQTAAECIAALEQPWDEVHLDHDLGGERFVDSEREDCGMEVVRWACRAPRAHLRTTRFLVHSHNFNAATMMALQLLLNGFSAEARPFGVSASPEAIDPCSEVPRPRTFRTWVSWLRRLFLRDAPAVALDRVANDSPPVETFDFNWTLPLGRMAPSSEPEKTSEPGFEP